MTSEDRVSATNKTTSTRAYELEHQIEQMGKMYEKPRERSHLMLLGSWNPGRYFTFCGITKGNVAEQKCIAACTESVRDDTHTRSYRHALTCPDTQTHTHTHHTAYTNAKTRTPQGIHKRKEYTRIRSIHTHIRTQKHLNPHSTHAHKAQTHQNIQIPTDSLDVQVTPMGLLSCVPRVLH